MTESVHHPTHYNSGKIEVADFIADQKLDFFLGNAVKYISRAGRKIVEKTIEDLEKARWYINYKIVELGGKDWSPDSPSDDVLDARALLSNFDVALQNEEIKIDQKTKFFLDELGVILDMR